MLLEGEVSYLYGIVKAMYGSVDGKAMRRHGTEHLIKYLLTDLSENT